MQPARTPLPPILTKYLPWGERFFLVASFIGLVLHFMNAGSQVMFMSLTGLAMVYFLYPYRPLETPGSDQKQGFTELLAFTIVPKVSWISCSVCVIGILFYLLNYEGAKQMLFIGSSTLSFILVIIAIFFVTGVKNVNALVFILYRAVPVVFVCLYIFLKYGLA